MRRSNFAINGSDTLRRNRIHNDGKFIGHLRGEIVSSSTKLKSLGIGVIFMNDGFTSLDPDSELRLSIMGSIAQEESRKTSSRVKWGQTRQMERGVVFGTSLLGYDVCDGKLTINPEGAEIVRLIFQKYGIEKKGTSIIARELREAGFKTYSDNVVWNSSHIIKILHNEKYVGDLIQKKTITLDYLTHAKKYNRGEEELITIRDHHEPIIERELWDTVQEELTKRNRKNSTSGHSNRYVFSGKMVCGECGARFVARSKTRKSGSSYMRWGCYTASTLGVKSVDIQGNLIGCDIGKTIRDDLAMEALTKAIKSIPVDWGWIIQNLTNIVNAAVSASDDPMDDVQKLEKQIQQIMKKKEATIEAYVSGDLSKEELQHMKAMFDERLKPLKERLQACKKAKKPTPAQIQSDLQKQIKSIVTCKHIAEPFYKALLEKVVIQKDGTFQISINHIPQVWHFELQYHKTSQEEK